MVASRVVASRVVAARAEAVLVVAARAEAAMAAAAMEVKRAAAAVLRAEVVLVRKQRRHGRSGCPTIRPLRHHQASR